MIVRIFLWFWEPSWRGSEARRHFRMRTLRVRITTRSARLLNLKDYGLEVGKSADLAVLDAESPEHGFTLSLDFLWGAELLVLLDEFREGLDLLGD